MENLCSRTKCGQKIVLLPHFFVDKSHTGPHLSTIGGALVPRVLIDRRPCFRYYYNIDNSTDSVRDKIITKFGLRRDFATKARRRRNFVTLLSCAKVNNCRN